jgi:CelD/BcsL family acetyltransferase involved in cellulose biosynthesis
VTPISSLDPVADPRWSRFVDRHPRASIFHTGGWLEALQQTYGYRPVALTTAHPDQELRDAVVFCRIETLLSGGRLVSLPFADHCDPLVSSAGTLDAMLKSPHCQLAPREYLELRPRTSSLVPPGDLVPCRAFHLHALDLSPSTDELLRSFHRDGVQRKLRRAQRERLVCEEGRSDALLEAFYRLFILTRRRHGLPPQPREWFRNLVRCLGDALTIRVAYKGGRPIACLITLRHRQTLVYKYGASDVRFHNLGGVILLFWSTIEAAKREGLTEFDLGRCDLDNAGLATFKDHWGATRSTLTYLRRPEAAALRLDERVSSRFARKIIAHAPPSLLELAGRLLYRHAG